MKAEKGTRVRHGLRPSQHFQACMNSLEICYDTYLYGLTLSAGSSLWLEPGHGGHLIKAVASICVNLRKGHRSRVLKLLPIFFNLVAIRQNNLCRQIRKADMVYGFFLFPQEQTIFLSWEEQKYIEIKSTNEHVKKNGKKIQYNNM